MRCTAATVLSATGHKALRRTWCAVALLSPLYRSGPNHFLVNTESKIETETETEKAPQTQIHTNTESPRRIQENGCHFLTDVGHMTCLMVPCSYRSSESSSACFGFSRDFILFLLIDMLCLACGFPELHFFPLFPLKSSEVGSSRL